MINAIFAAGIAPEMEAVVDPGYLAYGGRTVYDAVVRDLAELPVDADLLGAWDWDTGSIVVQPVADLLSIYADGQPTDKHLWAGQASRQYA